MQWHTTVEKTKNTVVNDQNEITRIKMLLRMKLLVLGPAIHRIGQRKESYTKCLFSCLCCMFSWPRGRWGKVYNRVVQRLVGGTLGAVAIWRQQQCVLQQDSTLESPLGFALPFRTQFGLSFHQGRFPTFFISLL